MSGNVYDCQLMGLGMCMIVNVCGMDGVDVSVGLLTPPLNRCPGGENIWETL